MVVEQLLTNLNLAPIHVGLGEIELAKPASQMQLEAAGKILKESGFELLDNQKQKQIEKVKTLLIKKVQTADIDEHFSIIDFLSGHFNKEYSAISRLFSEVEGITIEQFFILQKIEKVKELLVYAEYNLNEISYMLGYSSVAHLSAQFKKVTGLTPSHFKTIGFRQRKSLDKVSNK
jgi:AraC-like DNA-binding protein